MLNSASVSGSDVKCVRVQREAWLLLPVGNSNQQWLTLSPVVVWEAHRWMWINVAGGSPLKERYLFACTPIGQQVQSWKNPTRKLQGQQEFQKKAVSIVGVTCLQCPCLRIVKWCRWKLNTGKAVSHGFWECTCGAPVSRAGLRHGTLRTRHWP